MDLGDGSHMDRLVVPDGGGNPLLLAKVSRRLPCRMDWVQVDVAACKLGMTENQVAFFEIIFLLSFCLVGNFLCTAKVAFGS